MIFVADLSMKPSAGVFEQFFFLIPNRFPVIFFM